MDLSGDADLLAMNGGEDPTEMLRRGTTTFFPLDADNELSYSKMQMVID